MGFNMNYLDLLWSIPALVIAIVGHEVGHGLMAYFLGDETAKRDGRLSINPLDHIDPVGLLFMVVFRFGWAKAVPIDPRHFKNRKLGMILVSIAGVGVNFLFAILIAPFWALSNKYSWSIEPFFINFLWYNVMLGVFNLVPLPPLDGSKILASLLPNKWEYYFYKYERYFYILLFFGVMSGIVSRFIGPIIESLILLIGSFGWMLVQ